jgi:adenine-specific DNA-methyltransferase
MFKAAAVAPVDHTSKALGAFYTDAQIADFLVWWAIRSSHDTVLDPSFGGGVFLQSACTRISELGGNPYHQVSGVEVDPKVHCQTTQKLKQESGVDPSNLWLRDFFDFEPLPVREVTAVVGNPPFIRYQRFRSDVRKRALSLAAEKGIKLTQLASSWAPFVTHSISMIKKHGRLAMVVPMEISHASYALPVVEHLRNSFRKCTFLTFRKKLFPSLSEDTLLILAEDLGGHFVGFYHRDLDDVDALTSLYATRDYRISTRKINASDLTNGKERLIEYLIPKKARELYQELKALKTVRKLGELVDVGIGYVTGANEFFHLSQTDVKNRNIPQKYLKPAVLKGRALQGLRFTQDDWDAALETGQAGYLLSLSRDEKLPTSVTEYLEFGNEICVPEAYKCRVRKPWYSVPHVYQPDAFLTYMSGTSPRFVSNQIGAVAPNTLHVVRVHPNVPLIADAITGLWQTSLTRLSSEVEGHAMGGGMLKLEPTEAERCLVTGMELNEKVLLNLSSELDTMLRAGKDKDARTHADRIILRDGMGLSHRDCETLKRAAQILVDRRYSRT